VNIPSGCELQGSWTDTNTPAMAERGLIIRDVIPNSLRSQHGELAGYMRCAEADFGVQGRDRAPLG
jgi:hypothetical protein